MEYMDGGSLTEILDQHAMMQLTEPQIALIMLEVDCIRRGCSLYVLTVV